ncbi:MAG: hypothetical protein ACLP5H_29970 [Desulfomonilaceae bacterium]
MNLAVKLPRDKPSLKDLFRPFQLVSLWDMLDICADRFVGATAYLLDLHIRYQLSSPEDHEVSRPNPLAVSKEVAFTALRTTTLSRLQELHKDLLSMECCVTANLIEQIIGRIGIPDDRLMDLIVDEIGQINLTLIRELKSKKLYTIPAREAQYYEKRGTILGEELLSKSPGLGRLREDAGEAGNCFALGRYTACVFHLMRIMETLVQEFADILNATNKDGSPLDLKKEKWYRIEAAISRAIKTMDEGDLKNKYSVTLDSLSRVRARWRNDTMHPKKTYTENEAEQIIGAVQAFTEDFATWSSDEGI